MIQIRQFGTGNHFTVVSSSASGCTIIVAADSPLPNTSGVEQILLAAIAQISLESDGASAQCARIVQEILRAKTSDRAPEWIFFAAVLIAAGRVEVCTAGSFRVHVLKQGKSLGDTLDHTLANDHPDTLVGVPADVIAAHGGLPTRSLGLGNFQDPEELRLPVVPPFRIYIASQDWRAYQSYEEYSDDLLRFGRGEPSARQDGMVVAITVE